MRQVKALKRAADGRDVHADAFLRFHDGLQLAQRDVMLGAHFAV
jgi:hypothetical protein